MLLRIVEHCGADTVTAVCAVEDIDIDASLASAPERLVISEVIERYRMIAELRIHLHNGRTEVSEKIFACGHRTLARVNVRFLMRFDRPRPR